MATVTKKNARQLGAIFGGAAPWGNAIKLFYQFITNSAGVMVDSDQATAVNIDDKVILGVIPRGMRIDDAQFRISDAFAGSTTFNLGFEYCDGVDDTVVAQDDDAFAATVASSSLAILRMATTVKPVILPKDAYLILTVKGANHSAVGVMDITLEGTNQGVG